MLNRRIRKNKRMRELMLRTRKDFWKLKVLRNLKLLSQFVLVEKVHFSPSSLFNPY